MFYTFYTSARATSARWLSTQHLHLISWPQAHRMLTTKHHLSSYCELFWPDTVGHGTVFLITVILSFDQAYYSGAYYPRSRWIWREAENSILLMNKLPQKIEQLLNFHVLGLRPQHSTPQQGTANEDKSDWRKNRRREKSIKRQILRFFGCFETPPPQVLWPKEAKGCKQS